MVQSKTIKFFYLYNLCLKCLIWLCMCVLSHTSILIITCGNKYIYIFWLALTEHKHFTAKYIFELFQLPCSQRRTLLCQCMKLEPLICKILTSLQGLQLIPCERMWFLNVQLRQTDLHGSPGPGWNVNLNFSRATHPPPRLLLLRSHISCLISSNALQAWKWNWNVCRC